jgi:hypothetical protein
MTAIGGKSESKKNNRGWGHVKDGSDDEGLETSLVIGLRSLCAAAV